MSKVTYRVIKVWERPVDELLAGSAALMPMAVLSREIQDKEDVEPVLDRLQHRLNESLPGRRKPIRELWTAAEIYLGLKFPGEENQEWIRSITRKAIDVKESSTYQAIFNEGQVQARLDTLLLFGSERWGSPNEGEKVALEAINDPDRLERMTTGLSLASRS